MANDFWTLNIIYAWPNDIADNFLNITFSATGEIDFNRTKREDFDNANALLAPSFALIHAIAGPGLDIWKLLNWLFVSWYWTLLYDLGQTSVTTYVPLRTWIIADFTQPLLHPPTNNIFVNDTLFQTYSNYLREILFPLGGYQTAPVFLPLDDTNYLKAAEATFLRTYSCTERRLKGGWFFSVFATDFAFVSGAYTLILLIAARLERRRGQNCKFLRKPL